MPKYPRNIFNLCFKLFWWIETFLIAFETKKQNVQYLHTYDLPVEEPFNNPPLNKGGPAKPENFFIRVLG